ncbi:hypothetical protein EMIT0P176_240021 [Pseudomonas sp. IT-P176]|uniref:hypothetical protein n=1 Tax=unclassified Pseudomonas TaxID=196821 RepID=UPI0013967D71|nr:MULTISPECIES: hypothetical protein [unclassified Pseudomonas]MDX9664743.1 hypothetical protein [Pseudomonas sp. P5_152]
MSLYKVELFTVYGYDGVKTSSDRVNVLLGRVVTALFKLIHAVRSSRFLSSGIFHASV